MGKLRIETLGTVFTIQANEDNEYLEKLLGYYNQIVKNVQTDIASVKSPLQIAILSGIMLCDELYKEKQNKIAMENGDYTPIEFSADQQEIERKTQEMIDKINKVLEIDE